MKRSKRNLIVGLIVLVALLVMVVPAAADPPGPVGPRISVITGPDTFPAGEPFHLVHGWTIVPNFAQPGKIGFELELDGQIVEPSGRFNRGLGAGGDPPNLIVRLWGYNYPEGLPAGEYTFTGHWYLPCQPAVDGFGYPGPCDHPNDIVEPFTDSLEVTFTP